MSAQFAEPSSVNPCRCGHEKADHQQRLGQRGNYTPCCHDDCRCCGFRKARPARQKARPKALAAALLFVLAGVAPASAQGAPFPGAVNIDGGWVPCSHQLAIDRGLGCTGTTPTPNDNPV